MRRTKKSFVCVFFVILGLPAALDAQTSSDTPVDFGVWFTWQGNHPLNTDSRWRLIVEGIFRRNKGILTPEKYAVKGGIGYQWDNGLRVAAGARVDDNFPFDSSS